MGRKWWWTGWDERRSRPLGNVEVVQAELQRLRLFPTEDKSWSKFYRVIKAPLQRTRYFQALVTSD